MADPLGLKKALDKRMRAESTNPALQPGAAASAPAQKPPVDFLKAFTDEEKAAQRAKLAKILAAQGQ